MQIKNAIATILIISIATSIIFAPIASGQLSFPPGTHIATYARINVAPNPIGVGQTVTVNFYLATPLKDSTGPQNMTVKITDPTGTVKTMGPYTGDTTGGTFFTFAPDKVGEWKFQMFYGGQVTVGGGMGGGNPGLIQDPSESEVFTLTVQEEPITQTAYPITPLPTCYWETPVSAQNVQNWYKIMGPWLGLGSITFASTGAYNVSSLCNPYTPSVLSGHVLWTKTWGAGGVVGGSAGGTEDSGHYWSTRQYWPQYAPVIMNGKMYSTYYPETTGYSNGILCTDLYTGETLWKINTTSVLRCGMITQWQTPNMYGVIGPYIWTTGNLPASETGGKLVQSTGTEMGMFGPQQRPAYNMYSAETGQYVLSIVNGASMSIKEDAKGNLIGYYLNSTVGTMYTYGPAASFGGAPVTGSVQITAGHPVLCAFNFSQALGNAWGWSPSVNTGIDFRSGVMWAKPIPTEIGGVPISPQLAMDSINPLGGDAVVLTSGYVHMQGGGDETAGWLVIASMDDTTGDLLMCKNFTHSGGYQSLLPYTRTTSCNIDRYRTITNVVNNKVDAIDTRTGQKCWTSTLNTPSGETNTYNTFGYKAAPVNGTLLIFGLGGDIWGLNGKTGAELWYTNTTKLIGDPGIETPYGIWPLWVFSSQAYTPEVAYLAVGHEYNPPLFHGAQLLAVNMTDGSLVWSELGTHIRSVAIANGVLLSLNAYDNQIYAFGKGPTKITVEAPSIGVTTATPIRITGTVTDVSAGTEQSEVAKNYPNGLPCISDADQSRWMEHVYQDQPKPFDITGVPIVFYVIDQNNNYRSIGTTVSSSNGAFGFTWTPDISGEYKLYASFEGSNSYWPTSAETSFYVSEPATTVTPTEAPPSIADQYFIPAIAGLFVLIIIVLVLLVVLLFKKKE
ncbi:MAG: PQQ-binding-like beta-propeller repeat protein [Candidatus Bathyarchaeota archaeon]|nr:PQQ-binding-like beta-propeller repeat protein [Candidatus Bathyarchaeota archaeon]